MANLQLPGLLSGQCEESKRHSALWLTDINDTVLERCHDNIQLPCNASSRHPHIYCRPLNWSDALNPQDRPALTSSLLEIDADVIIGADIVYDPGIIPDLVCSLRLALKARDFGESGQIAAYIALTIRNEATLAQFLREAASSLNIEDIHTCSGSSQFSEADASRYEQVKIYKMTRRIQMM